MKAILLSCVDIEVNNFVTLSPFRIQLECSLKLCKSCQQQR